MGSVGPLRPRSAREHDYLSQVMDRGDGGIFAAFGHRPRGSRSLVSLACGAMRTDRELGQMPNEHDELPAIVVFFLRAPRRHSGQPNAIVDDVVDLSVREALGVGQTHVRCLRIEILANLRLSASVIAMASGAMIREVSARLAENFGGRREGILGVTF